MPFLFCSQLYVSTLSIVSLDPDIVAGWIRLVPYILVRNVHKALVAGQVPVFIIENLYYTYLHCIHQSNF